MHYSRVSIPPEKAYSPATVVLLNELIKGGISFLVALFRVPEVASVPWRKKRSLTSLICALPFPWTPAFWYLCADIFSPDCWKLSIPASLYVVQNSLQFVAVSNLPVASFQVAYQMKILTTAAFSVALLRKKLTSTKWLSLFFLAIGVAIVQIQTTATDQVHKNVPVGSAHDSAPLHIHVMSPLKGFGAVVAACFTSGLAGVYFEMVLKNSKADLWVRNVQLSLFSLIPALLPVIYTQSSAEPHFDSTGFFGELFRNFGGWAWATVGIQVFGGLVTALVIKYSDNIMKGFATSLSIILSFLASVALFDFTITPSFMIGAGTVLWSTWMYNQPEGKESVSIIVMEKPSAFGSPEPILGDFSSTKKRTSPFGSPRAMASAFKLSASSASLSEKDAQFGAYSDVPYHPSPYGTPYPSRPPSRAPTRPPSRATTPNLMRVPPQPSSPHGSDISDQSSRRPSQES